MNSSHNFQFICVIIFVTSLHSILLIDIERGPRSFTSRTKQGHARETISHFLFFPVPPLDMGKPATGEGMDKSTLVHTQIQIIIIHFLPSPIPPIPNR
jgi:hypothetical protein